MLAALRFRNFRLLIGGRFIAQLGEMMVSVAIGYELYLRTREPFLLGLVGLVQVVPVIFLALPAGYLVDRYDRRWMTAGSQAVLVACSLGLAYLSFTQGPLVLIYALLATIGVARAFNNPAESALTPLTVPADEYENAATWNSSMWQTAAILGPAVGGLIIAATGTALAVYLANAAAGVVLIAAILALRLERAQQYTLGEKPMESLRGGLRFLGQTRILLAAITLDMFAVLFGGATALLPIYATDILQVDATGLGILRAAPSVGAIAMALTVARRPPFERAGRVLLVAVAGFGLATIVFGLSTNFWLSLLMLALLGALDNISVIIRSTLFMKQVPDEMRGRVGSVNSLFIGISNEMGSFQSGLVASIPAFGPVGAVVSGGIGAIIVVGLVAWRSPQLRGLRRL
jgi:MFS family permease